jgi:hypothetical protein
MKRYLMLPVILFASFPMSVGRGQDNCTPIHFAPGQSSTSVKGVAPFGTPFTCFNLIAGRGQTASIRLTKSNGNTAFNISGIVDNQDNYTFRTEARTYKIDVYQITRELASRDAQFTMQVTLR